MTRTDPSDLYRGVADAAARAGRIYADFVAGLGGRPVAPPTDRPALREAFLGSVGDEGVGLDRMLDDVEQLVLPNSMTTPHPCYAGLVNSSPLPAAPIADLVVSMLNNNGGAFHQSPAATTAEEEVLRVFCRLLGYPEDASGLLLPGGSFANLHGLMLARTAHFPGWLTEGASAAVEPRLYTSRATHFSVTRTAQVLGFGTDQIVALPALGRGTLDVDALRERVLYDRAAGASPFCVVATIGTTGTGAIDDVAAIADACRELGLWLHVDACYGGAIALLDEFRPRLAGLEVADSVAIDPHKWFFMPIVAGLALTRHPDVEHAVYGIDAPYIPSDDEIDAFCRGLPTSRRSSGLTVWAALRAHGLAPIRDAVRRNIGQMRRLEARLAEAGFEVLPGGELSIAVARFAPEGMSPEDVDGLQPKIAQRVIDSGDAWFSTTRHDGKTWLRFNVVNLHTRDEHVQRMADAVVAASRDLYR